MLAEAMDPDCIGERVVRAIREGEFYVLTHPDWRDRVEHETTELLAGFTESAEPGYHEDFERLARAAERQGGAATEPR